MKKLLLSMLVFFLGWTTLAVHAATINSLYHADVPVATQSTEERAKATQQGLAQVLIKLSGSRQVIDNPTIKAKLTAAENLVEQFGYERSQIDKPYLLQLDFDPKAINHVLQAAHVSVWGQNRPLILAWVEYEVPNKPAEIISDPNHDIIIALKQQAERRGLPFVVPQMDVTDLSHVSVNDIVTMQIPILANAAKRYGNDAMLIGRIFQLANGRYSGQWKLVEGTNQTAWETDGDTLPNVIAAVVDRAADTLASQYAIVLTNAASSKLTVKISGITEQNDFADVMRYLKHLPPVADVTLLNALEDAVVLSVSVRGTKQTFGQSVSGEQSLTPLADGSDPAVLLYHWNH